MKIKSLNKNRDRSKMKVMDCHVQWELSKIKAADGGIIIEGYANTNDKDRVSDIVLPTAFTKTLPEYMENPVLLFQHNWDLVIGTVTDAKITDKGLYVKAKISNAKDVEDVRTKINEGALRTFSIGYNEVDAVEDPTKKANIVKELELLEISVVTIPANSKAKFTVVSSEKSEEKDLEAALMDVGFANYLVTAVGQLDDGEEITADFLKELQEVYQMDIREKEGKSFKPKSVKGWTQAEVIHHDSALGSTIALIKTAAAALAQTVASCPDKPTWSELCMVSQAMGDVGRNLYEAENHVMAIDNAKYSGVTLAAPKEEAEKDAKDDGKGGAGSGGARAGAGRKPGSGGSDSGDGSKETLQLAADSIEEVTSALTDSGSDNAQYVTEEYKPKLEEQNAKVEAALAAVKDDASKENLASLKVEVETARSLFQEAMEVGENPAYTDSD